MNDTATTISFGARARVAEGVLFRELEGESVILSLEGETYYGLDAVGTRMWAVLCESATVQRAYEKLCSEYDVDPAQLRRDLEELLGELVARRLLTLHAV